MAIKKSPGGLRVRWSESIFGGDYSRPMWDLINKAKTVAQLREALYMVGCRLQEFESKMAEAIGRR